MNPCQDYLLKLLAKALFDRDIINTISRVDYNSLLEEANKQTVVQLAYSALDKTKMREEEVVLWSQCRNQLLANNLRIIYNHSLLHRLMEDAEIPYTILKGYASAAYYPEPCSRALGDVDFIVSEESLRASCKTLEKAGLVLIEDESSPHYVYQKNGMEFDMHSSIPGLPNGTDEVLVKEYTRDIIDSSNLIKVGNQNMRVPSPFHHGLVLLLHTCQHMTGEGIGLRHLCDWAVFVNGYSDSEFVDMFEEKLKQIGLWKFSQILTRTSIRYLGADEKKWAQCDDSITDCLIEDILIGGNFGRKEANKSIQNMLIANGGETGIGEKGMALQFVEAVNKTVYLRWPSSRHMKMLIPLGWVYFGFNRIIREITGKRVRTDIGQEVNRALERKKLYRQFGLFEPENNKDRG